jgi:hypothetical protein
MPMFRDTGKPVYYFTVSWDGISEETEGSVTYTRESFSLAVDGIKYYLDKYKERSPYISGLSFVQGESSENLLTDKLKNKIEKECNG